MSKLFNRRSSVAISGNTFSSEDFSIEFKVSLDTASEPNKAEITIFNLKDSTSKLFKKDVGIVLNAGYEGDVGTLFAGDVESAFSSWENVDKKTTSIAYDGMTKWMNKTVNKTYKPNTKASQVVTDVLKIFGMEIGKFKLAKDVTYKNGKTVSGSIQFILRQIVNKECNSKFYIQGGAIIILPKNTGVITAFVLNSDTGLIGSPEYFEREDNDLQKILKGYKVKCLLNHQIRIDSIIKLESKVVKGLFRVIKCTHIGNENDYISEMEVLPNE